MSVRTVPCQFHRLFMSEFFGPVFSYDRTIVGVNWWPPLISLFSLLLVPGLHLPWPVKYLGKRWILKLTLEAFLAREIRDLGD